MSIKSLFITISLSASLALAQLVPATASVSALATVDGQFVNSGLATSGNTGFGTPLKSSAILTVQYPFGIVQNGSPYTVAQVSNAPLGISVTPQSASTFTATQRYTLILADASSLGDPDTQGNYRHFLQNSLTGTPGSGANLTFAPTGGNVITNYASPGPIVGTGPHRYAWLLLTEPTTFTAPANLSSNTSPGHWSVNSYISSTGLTLVASTFFTVENGTPTGSVAVTSAFSTSIAAAATTPPAATGTGAGIVTSTTRPAVSSSAPVVSTTAKTTSAASIRSISLAFISVITLVVGSTLM